MAGDDMRDNMCGTWVWFFSLSPIHASHGLGLWRLNYSSTLQMLLIVNHAIDVSLAYFLPFHYNNK